MIGAVSARNRKCNTYNTCPQIVQTPANEGVITAAVEKEMWRSSYTIA